MKRSRKFLIIAALLTALVVWFFFGRREARMLKDAKRVSTAAEVEAFATKYEQQLHGTPESREIFV